MGIRLWPAPDGGQGLLDDRGSAAATQLTIIPPPRGGPNGAGRRRALTSGTPQGSRIRESARLVGDVRGLVRRQPKVCGCWGHPCPCSTCATALVTAGSRSLGRCRVLG